MNLRIFRASTVVRILLFTATIGLLVEAAIEFYNVSWGTGTLWGEFSLKWGMAFLSFLAFCILCLLVTGYVLWDKQKTEPIYKRLAIWRGRMGWLRWLVAFAIVILPICFFQYSPWGVVFSKPFIRLLVWCFTVIFLAFFLT